MATDSRASAGDWIASQTVKKVIEINSCLLGTMAGGAAVGSEDYQSRTQLTMNISGLSILVSLPWDAMSTPRASPQAPHISRSSLQNPLESCLLLQGYGFEYGYDVCWCNASRRSCAILH